MTAFEIVGLALLFFVMSLLWIGIAAAFISHAWREVKSTPPGIETAFEINAQTVGADDAGKLVALLTALAQNAKTKT